MHADKASSSTSLLLRRIPLVLGARLHCTKPTAPESHFIGASAARPTSPPHSVCTPDDGAVYTTSKDTLRHEGLPSSIFGAETFTHAHAHAQPMRYYTLLCVTMRYYTLLCVTMCYYTLLWACTCACAWVNVSPAHNVSQEIGSQMGSELGSICDELGALAGCTLTSPGPACACDGESSSPPFEEPLCLIGAQSIGVTAIKFLGVAGGAALGGLAVRMAPSAPFPNGSLGARCPSSSSNIFRTPPGGITDNPGFSGLPSRLISQDASDAPSW